VPRKKLFIQEYIQGVR